MNKKIILFAFLITVGMGTFAQYPDCKWAISAGGEDTDFGRSLCVDADHNVIFCGSFKSATFAIGGENLSNHTSGLSDIFLAKFSVDGNLKWAKSYGGESRDEAYSVASDANGSIYLTGIFRSDSLLIDTILIHPADTFGNNFFLAKFDSLGDVQWVRNAGSLSLCSSTDVCCDTYGNVMLSGYFTGSPLDIGDTILADQSSNTNAFLIKYDQNGQLTWAFTVAGNSDSYFNSVAVDVYGNIFVAGSFDGDSLNLGTEWLVSSDLSPFLSEAFIARFTPDGNVSWVRKAQGTNYEWSNSLACDLSGNAVMTGYFIGAEVSFDTIQLDNLSNSSAKGFVVKYDSIGQTLWARTSAGTAGEVINDVYCDAAGDIFICGEMGDDGTLVYGNDSLQSYGGSDIYAVQLNASGNPQKAISTGSWADDWAGSISGDTDGSIYLCGKYEAPFGFGSCSMNHMGEEDAFLVALQAGFSGLQKFQKEERFLLYPNPCREFVTISISSYNTSFFIRISDLNGNLLLDKELHSQNTEINTSSLAAGVYVAEIFINGVTYRQKLLIIK